MFSPTKLHGFTSQKTVLFIVAVARSSDFASLGSKYASRVMLH
jgi:hypothetical protein